MIALLRSDLYRIARSRWVWVVLAALTLLTIAPAVLMRVTDMGPDAFDSLTSSALGLGGVEVIAAVFVVLAICRKGDFGFDRTVLSSLGRRARMVWYAEKCLLAVLITGACSLAILVLGLVALAVSGVPVRNVEPAWQIALWLVCTWLVASVYAVLTVVVGHLMRNETVTSGFAVLASLGLLEGGLLLACDLVVAAAGGGFLALSEAVAPWMPTTILAAMGDGAAAMLSAESSVGVAPVVRAVIVCLPLLAAAFAADALVVSRRDMA